MTSPLKNIPSVDRILSSQVIEATAARYGRQRTTEFVRRVLSGIRSRVQADESFDVRNEQTVTTLSRQTKHRMLSQAFFTVAIFRPDRERTESVPVTCCRQPHIYSAKGETARRSICER